MTITQFYCSRLLILRYVDDDVIYAFGFHWKSAIFFYFCPSPIQSDCIDAVGYNGEWLRGALRGPPSPPPHSSPCPAVCLSSVFPSSSESQVCPWVWLFGNNLVHLYICKAIAQFRRQCLPISSVQTPWTRTRPRSQHISLSRVWREQIKQNSYFLTTQWINSSQYWPATATH